MKAGAQKHQLKMTAAGKPGSTQRNRRYYVGRWERRKELLEFQCAGGKYLMWGMNNVKEIELDDDEHKEGQERQKRWKIKR